MKMRPMALITSARLPLLVSINAAPRPGVPALPLPERHGEPSLFEHVVYVIKENRTYDQVFGDMKEGNGDASLCIFGERITPRVRLAVVCVSIAIGLLLWFLAHNTLENMRVRGIQSGFDFLGQPAGFDIGELLIPYDSANAYWKAFLVGLVMMPTCSPR
mgnify:CR=1 FL=1